jgi:two-component system, NtrC family, response regulator PilR
MLHSPPHILIVDDDQSVRDVLAIVFRKEGYRIDEAINAGDALKKLKNCEFDLIVSDIKMPDLSGIELLKKVKSIHPEMPFVLITAFASANDAVEAMKLGAADYITKPFDLDELRVTMDKILRKTSSEHENVELKTSLEDKDRFENIIGSNPRMLKIFELIDAVAMTNSTVLISGESGTGKELIARAIHNKSPRRDRKFVSINCGALPENLLESELFGHRKGAFTDAYQEKEGLFEVASSGTLFLDEIAEMSQKMQVKLLRAIQEKIIRRVGGNSEIQIDVRIIAATNRDLVERMNSGEFRSDLYYRLNVIAIQVPPLRERHDDIPVLVHHLLAATNERFNRAIKGVEKEVMNLFVNYPWPGNVRELENIIERAVALEKGEYITPTNLPQELVYNISAQSQPQVNWLDLLRENRLHFSDYIDELSRSILLKTLEMNGWNVKKASEHLKLNYRSMRYLIEKYHLKT